jgi:hypothetical protein
MKSRSRSAASVAVLLIATLAACESSGPDESPSTGAPDKVETTPLSAEPADGNAIANDDFTYSVPQGWEQSELSRAVSLAVDVEDSTDGFPDNMHVVSQQNIVGLEGDELTEAAEDILAEASATRITTADPVEIDGEQAVHTSAVFELSVPKYRVEQYVVVHDERGYVITLSFSPDVPAAERHSVSESILTTWKWDS